MYLHIGGDVAVSLNEVIAIIDLEIGRKKEATREFLSLAAEDQTVIHIGREESEKSVVITRRYIYYSPISTATLLKRAQLMGKTSVIKCI
ncbi:MAG TPA: DUF370 domain-containing protein [Syntrophomonadaceae bacterium]|nr:DUF370 domain-containing protein [Syntrophomonadaceae bacterium]